MKCNYIGLSRDGWDKVGCSEAVAAKCKVCGNYTCANHKYTLGAISPGVTIASCNKCYKVVVKAGANLSYQRGSYSDTFVDPSPNPFKVFLKVKNNLCCVLNPQIDCRCGQKICSLCNSDKIKPHDQCEYVYNRKLLAWAKKRI